MSQSAALRCSFDSAVFKLLAVNLCVVASVINLCAVDSVSLSIPPAIGDRHGFAILRYHLAIQGAVAAFSVSDVMRVVANPFSGYSRTLARPAHRHLPAALHN